MFNLEENLDKFDIGEFAVNDFNLEVMKILLLDRTTNKNILWCTDDYIDYGEGYGAQDEILIEKITGNYGNIIRPRALKSNKEKRNRTRDKAEVFTPAWVCNAQNNLIDNAWFCREGVFNRENLDHTWSVNLDKVTFPEGKSWKDYILDTRIEFTCGEAPYLVSRYDTTSGELIPIENRIGLLDRKLRIINENIDDHKEWIRWVQIAYQNIYGYEWQGDNLLLARQALLQTFIEFHFAKFGNTYNLSIETILEIANIISWNLWQMDGLKGVIPNSCTIHTFEETDLFGEVTIHTEECQGCKNDNLRKHNGKYSVIKDWQANKENQVIRFIDLIK